MFFSSNLLPVSAFCLVTALAAPANASASPTAPGQTFVTEFKSVPETLFVKAGNVLPVDLELGGDLFANADTTAFRVAAKRDLWIRVRDDQVQVSFDGTHFDAWEKCFTGSLSARADAGPSGEVDGFSIKFVLSPRSSALPFAGGVE